MSIFSTIMDKYLLIGNVLAPTIYQQWIHAGEIINPSHQLFFSRFIQAFARHHPLQVISVPSLRKTTKKIIISQTFLRDGNVWYLPFKYVNLQVFRPWLLLWSLYWNSQQLLKKTSGNLIIFVDGNSPLASWMAKRLHRIKRVKTVGIFTDDPRQLTGMKPSLAKRWIHRHYHHDGYVGISGPLLNIFNRKKRPSLIIPGIVETPTGAKHHPRPYLFFSGALYPRYGIEAMIKGFLSASLKNMDLLIAGFGPEASMVEQVSQHHRQIKFLGLLPPALVQKYQAGAYANLNPRPLDASLDDVAIPSKIFDYIAAGVPCLTTRHPFFETTFANELQWIEEASEDGIRVALTRFIESDYAIAQGKANQAKQMAIDRYGIIPTGQALEALMSSLK